MSIASAASALASAAITGLHAHASEVIAASLAVAVASLLDLNNIITGAIGTLVLVGTLVLTRRRDRDRERHDENQAQVEIANSASAFAQNLLQRMSGLEGEMERLKQEIVRKDIEIGALRQTNSMLEMRVNQLVTYCTQLYAALVRVSPAEAAQLGDPALYGVAIAPVTQPLIPPVPPSPAAPAPATMAPARKRTRRKAAVVAATE